MPCKSVGLTIVNLLGKVDVDRFISLLLVFRSMILCNSQLKGQQTINNQIIILFLEKTMTMDPNYTKSIFFQYSDIFFSYYFDHDTHCTNMLHHHSLTYVYSGEMVIEEKGSQIVIGAGECAFIKKNHRVFLTKQSKDGHHYKGIFMSFTRNVLREFYKNMNADLDIDSSVPKINQSVIKLPNTPEVESLFHSMTPYFDEKVKPRDEFMQLKLAEGIYALLNIDKRFYPTLFDFTEPWKIDLIEFLDENYMEDLSMEEIANFTGRSLATFKRDFKKVSELTPQKWLIEKRLNVAHEMIRFQDKKVKDVFVDVGFKNLSHFSKVYKEKFGYAPTKQIETDSKYS